jgi:hypothetical protein
MFNLGSTENLQTIKLNVTLVGLVAFDIETLFKEFHHELLNITSNSTPLSHMLIKLGIK